MANKLSVDQFNETYPVGSDAIYTDDLGGEHETKIRSEAWVLGHGDAVVMIEGGSGGFCIDRIKAAKNEG